MSLQKAQELSKQKIEELKEVVRKEVFIRAAVDPSHQLRLIDSVQRLGLSYHFETEIEEALKHIYDTYHGPDEEELYDAALRFRLLRQQGYFVSCGNFPNLVINIIYICISFEFALIMACQEILYLFNKYYLYVIK